MKDIDWSNLGFDGHTFTSEYLKSSTNNAMWQYRHKLLIGNFDNDKKDEILGIAT